MTARTLIERLREVAEGGFLPDGDGVNVPTKLWLEEVVRQHEAEQPKASEEVMGKIDKALEMVSALCMPRGSEGSRAWVMSIPARPDYDPDLVIADALASAKSAIAAMGGASETGIGNHASTARQQDHALTPPASEAYRKVREALEDAEIWIRDMRQAINTPKAEWFFLDARMQNLEAWNDGPRMGALDAFPEMRSQSAARWQPIETAPKDGTEITGGWAYPSYYQCGTPICWQKCAQREGWFMLSPTGEQDSGKWHPGQWLNEKDYPTHWMPRLTPPEGEHK